MRIEGKGTVADLSAPADETKRGYQKKTDKVYGPRNRMKFTEKNVLTLKPKRMKQYLIWDEGMIAARGLAILVSPTGTKSYRCTYRYPGDPKTHWMHLGRVGELTLEEARSLHVSARRKASKFEDPKSENPTKADTFRAAVESYIQHEQKGRLENKSADQTKAVMLSSCKEWHTRPVPTIRSKEIEEGLLWRIRDGHGDKPPRPYLANRVYSHLKAFFAWYAKRNKILSPMLDMGKPWNKAKPRDRDWFKKAAGDNAIKALWRSADEIGGAEGRYVKLMLLTGKRKTALASMSWDHIDENWLWDPPPSDAKNKRLNGVPLPKLAQRILYPRHETGNVFGRINLDKLQDKIRKASGIEDFFWHGLRHLAETKTAELRDARGHSLILPHIRDLLFDHASKRGSGKGYDHHDYEPELSAAIEVWAEYVEGLVQKQGAALLR
jgi:integrase